MDSYYRIAPTPDPVLLEEDNPVTHVGLAQKVAEEQTWDEDDEDEDDGSGAGDHNDDEDDDEDEDPNWFVSGLSRSQKPNHSPQGGGGEGGRAGEPNEASEASVEVRKVTRRGSNRLSRLLEGVGWYVAGQQQQEGEEVLQQEEQQPQQGGEDEESVKGEKERRPMNGFGGVCAV